MDTVKSTNEREKDEKMKYGTLATFIGTINLTNKYKECFHRVDTFRS